MFLQLFTFIVDKCKGMKYWRSDINVDENHQHQLRQGRPRSLSKLDEYFLTLVRLRHAFPEEHLAYIFKVSRSTVLRIFLSWINLLYFELGSIPIWQSKNLIWDTSRSANHHLCVLKASVFPRTKTLPLPRDC